MNVQKEEHIQVLKLLNKPERRRQGSYKRKTDAKSSRLKTQRVNLKWKVKITSRPYHPRKPSKKVIQFIQNRKHQMRCWIKWRANNLGTLFFREKFRARCKTLLNRRLYFPLMHPKYVFIEIRSGNFEYLVWSACLLFSHPWKIPKFECFQYAGIFWWYPI